MLTRPTDEAYAALGRLSRSAIKPRRRCPVPAFSAARTCARFLSLSFKPKTERTAASAPARSGDDDIPF